MPELSNPMPLKGAGRLPRSFQLREGHVATRQKDQAVRHIIEAGAYAFRGDAAHVFYCPNKAFFNLFFSHSVLRHVTGVQPVHGFLKVMLTAGNVHDVTVAEKLLSRVPLKGTTVLADKAYGKWALCEFIVDHDVDSCIPPRDSETDPWYVDWCLYKELHVVEKFFLKLKEFRRVPTHYDKLASCFLAFVHLACIRILLAYDEGQTFADLLRNCRAVMKAGLAHAKTSGNEYFPELQKRGVDPRTMTSFSIVDNGCAEVLFRFDAGLETDVPFHVRVNFNRDNRPGIQTLDFEYNSEIFTDSDVAQIRDGVVRVLEQAAEDPDVPVGDMTLLSRFGMSKALLIGVRSGSQVLPFGVKLNTAMPAAELVKTMGERLTALDGMGDYKLSCRTDVDFKPSILLSFDAEAVQTEAEIALFTGTDGVDLRYDAGRYSSYYMDAFVKSLETLYMTKETFKKKHLL